MRRRRPPCRRRRCRLRRRSSATSPNGTNSPAASKRSSRVEVRPRVTGYIESVNFTEGSVVRKGDLLFVIDPRPYRAELSKAEAELQRAIARAELAATDADPQREAARHQGSVARRVRPARQCLARSSCQRRCRPSRRRCGSPQSRIHSRHLADRGPREQGRRDGRQSRHGRLERRDLADDRRLDRSDLRDVRRRRAGVSQVHRARAPWRSFELARRSRIPC